MTTRIMVTKRTGIAILLKISMPLFTPRATIRQVAAWKQRKQMVGAHTPEENEENIPAASSGVSRTNARESDWIRYSSDQPPTTL